MNFQLMCKNFELMYQIMKKYGTKPLNKEYSDTVLEEMPDYSQEKRIDYVPNSFLGR